MAKAARPNHSRRLSIIGTLSSVCGTVVGKAFQLPTSTPTPGTPHTNNYSNVMVQHQLPLGVSDKFEEFISMIEPGSQRCSVIRYDEESVSCSTTL
jgi:hypothetical protein